MLLKSLFAQAGSALVVLAFSATAGLATQVDIMVNKVSQSMRVMVDGTQRYEWPVSTGAQGYDTPSGNFRIFRMEKDHFSKEWDDSPMPYSMFFTGIGHAIHGTYHTRSIGRAVSHGCVRLAPQNAAVLWDLVTKAGYKNNSVKIKGGLFDQGHLTTAETFNMTPSDRAALLASGGVVATPAGAKPPFWWVKPDTQQRAQSSRFDRTTKSKSKAETRGSKRVEHRKKKDRPSFFEVLQGL